MTHPLASIFDTLHASQQASQRSLDQVGRVNHPSLCTVTDNNDPERKRRIKVSDPAKPGLSTDWLRRLSFLPYDDPPLPPVGSTVMCLFDNGDETRGWYMQCQNATNPAFEKESAQNDWWRETPGHKTELVEGDQKTTVRGDDTERVDLNQSVSVGKNQTELVEGDRQSTIKKNDTERVDDNQVVSVGKQLVLQNDAGASLTLHQTGAVVLKDAFGNQLVLGGASGGLGTPTDFAWDTTSGNVRWNLSGNQLNIINAGDVTIAGKSVIVVGSTDSDNDINNTKGY